MRATRAYGQAVCEAALPPLPPSWGQRDLGAALALSHVSGLAGTVRLN